MSIGGHDSFHWRHWRCVTDRVMGNIEKKLEGSVIPDDIDGFEDLKPEDQAMLIEAFKKRKYYKKKFLFLFKIVY